MMKGKTANPLSEIGYRDRYRYKKLNAIHIKIEGLCENELD
jgi:hypothetical protein